MAVGGSKPPRRAKSIDVLANPDGPNPFAAPSTEFLREKRQVSKKEVPRGAIAKFRGPAHRAPSSEKPFDRDRKLLDAIDKLEDRDTRAQGAYELEQILSSLLPGELLWFLKFLLNRNKPLQNAKARREQLLLLVSVVHQFGSELGDGVLFDRILPFIIYAAANKDMHETAARVLTEIYHHLVPERGDFLSLTPSILKRLLDPLQLGTGWDVDSKRGTVFMLAALTPAVVDRAEEFGRRVEGEDGQSVGLLLENFATLLVQCMAVNQSHEEGLLQCLARLAACDPESIVPHARALAERCALHLLDTPSAVPDFAIEDGRPESPTRVTLLTRELALVCCLCLWHIADHVVPFLTQNELKAYYNTICNALSRDNLNLYRLTRNNDQLRMAIANANAAWQAVCDGDVPNSGDGEPGSTVPATWRADEEFSRGQQLNRLARPALTNGPPRERRGVSPGPRQRSPPPASAIRGRRPLPSGVTGDRLPAVSSSPRPASANRTASADRIKDKLAPVRGPRSLATGLKEAPGPRRGPSGPRAVSADRIMGRLTSVRGVTSEWKTRAEEEEPGQQESRKPSKSPSLQSNQSAPVSQAQGSVQGSTDATGQLVETVLPTEVPLQAAQGQADLPPPQSEPRSRNMSFDDLTNRALPMPGDFSDDEERGPPQSGPPLGPSSGTGGTFRPEQLRPPLPPSGVPSGRSGMPTEQVVTDGGWSHIREAAPDLPSYNPSLASMSDHDEREDPAWLQLRAKPRLGLKDSRPRSAPRPRSQEPRGAADRRGLMPCQRNNSSAPSVEDEHDDEGAEDIAFNQGPPERLRTRSSSGSAVSKAARSVTMADEARNGGRLPPAPARTGGRSAPAPEMTPQRSLPALDMNPYPASNSKSPPRYPQRSAPALDMNPHPASSSKSPPRYASDGGDLGDPKRTESGAAGPVPTAGCLPPRSPERKEMQHDELPPRPPPQAIRNLTAEAARMLDRDAPYLSAVMQYLTAGRVDHALQCAFQYGNEKTLRSALQLLNPRATWSQLPGDVGAYLAHVLVLLLCKDPLSEKAKEACVWLEGLVRIPGGREALARENQQELRKALFCLSGVPGEGGTLASWLYYQLFQDAR